MKTLLSLILILFPLYSFSDVYLTGKFGTYAFDVDNRGKSSSVSGMGAYALDIGYELEHNLMVSAIFNIIMADTFTGDQGFGFDIALKHYPISSPAFQIIKDDSLEVYVADLYRPYYGLAFRQREFLLILSTNYVGPSLFFGLDYQWRNDWYLNTEFRYDMLSGPSDAEAIQTNILFGIGRYF